MFSIKIRGDDVDIKIGINKFFFQF